ncbi:MAG TPA: hypothetical protein VNQ90_13310 [Chthoniobacteraceae bacterium]|nr:hypothetical protein [Chthoniobacteraceae bacterium]
MKYPLRKIAVGLMVSLAVASPRLSQAENFNWADTTGEASFHDAANWSPSLNAPPGSGDYAYFNLTNLSDYQVNAGADIDLTGLYVQNSSNVTLNLGTQELSTIKLGVYSGTLTLDGGATSIIAGAAPADTVLSIGSSGTGHLVLANQATLTFVSTGSSNLKVGGNSAAPNNTVKILTGSSLTAASPFYVGYYEGSGGNTVTVDGAGSKLVTSAVLSLGSTLAGSSSYSNNNKLEVLNGGRVEAAGQVRVGNGGVSSGNSVIVSGSGSSFSQTGTHLRIGNSGVDAPSSINNLFAVRNGATLTTSATVTVERGAGNTFEVSSGATATMSKDALIVHGLLSVDDATLKTRTLEVGATGRVEFSGGTFQVEQTLTATGGSRFVFDLAGLAAIELTGTTGEYGKLSVIDGPIYIDLAGVASAGAGSYDLFTYRLGEGISETTVLLGATPEGFLGALRFEDNSIVLDVSVVPEPGVAMLLGVAAAGVLLIARRLRR